MEVLSIIYTFFVISIITSSTSLNAIICYIIRNKFKEIELPNLFILSISISDIIHVLIGLVSELLVLHKVILTKKSSVCIGAAFLTFFITVSNSLQIVIISVMRMVALKCPFFYIKYCKTKKFRTILLCFCYTYGLLWASFPLLGWSKYEEDLDNKRCSLDWNLTQPDSSSYLFFAFLFCYILPVIMLIFAYSLTKKTVDNQSIFKRDQPVKQRELLEKVYIKLFLWSAIAYFVVWTPYAGATLLSIFNIKIPSLIYTICALFAKLSAILNAFTNCYINSFFKLFRQISNDNVTAVTDKINSTTINTLNTKVITITDTISTTVINITDTLNTAVINITETICTTVTNITDTINTTVIKYFKYNRYATVTNVTDAINTSVANITDTINTKLTNVIESINTSFTNIAGAINTAVTNIYDKLNTVFTNITDSINTTVTKTTDSISTTLINIIET
ncbi:vertebrate ancient opsin [Hydra vulgaris]|uniref:vertebrate ancient opsin n=1 Tax=Hydra vulgaris TaxID=6087 RepID=UPI0032EA0B63